MYLSQQFIKASGRLGSETRGSRLRVEDSSFTARSWDFPRPQRTYLFKDLYKEIIIRSPKKGRLFGVQVGFRGWRSLLLHSCHRQPKDVQLFSGFEFRLAQIESAISSAEKQRRQQPSHEPPI